MTQVTDTPAVLCAAVSKTFVESEGSESDDSESAPGPWWSLARRRRRVEAVRDVSPKVDRGEIFGVLGPNGSGKSTLIRLMATLLVPDSGTLHIFGRDVTRERMQVRRLINRVSVDAAFFKKLSAIENLRYAARLYGVPVGEGQRRALEILDRLGFSSRKARVPLENLSRGQQQKVAVARALLTSPVLLLMDEPTTGLDPRSKNDVQDFVLEVQREHGTTVILTSHDMTESDRLCNRVAFIDNGRIVALDTPQALKDRVPHEGGAPSLEDAFFYYTGRGWEEEVAD